MNRQSSIADYNEAIDLLADCISRCNPMWNEDAFQFFGIDLSLPSPNLEAFSETFWAAVEAKKIPGCGPECHCPDCDGEF